MVTIAPPEQTLSQKWTAVLLPGALGILIGFAFFGTWEVVHESVFWLGIFILFALIVVSMMIYFHRRRGTHDHHEHDSTDRKGIVTSNVLHATGDGLVLGFIALGGGLIGPALAALLLHEVPRVGALTIAYKKLQGHIFTILGTALLGLALGFGVALAGVEALAEYTEHIAAVAAMILLAVVAHIIYHHPGLIKKDWLFVLVGVLIAVTIEMITH